MKQYHVTRPHALNKHLITRMGNVKFCHAQDGNCVCMTIEDHSGEHVCGSCGYKWGARSDSR